MQKNKVATMKATKETVKSVAMETKHHSGKGTRARLNAAAEKMFYGSN